MLIVEGILATENMTKEIVLGHKVLVSLEDGLPVGYWASVHCQSKEINIKATCPDPTPKVIQTSLQKDPQDGR